MVSASQPPKIILQFISDVTPIALRVLEKNHLLEKLSKHMQGVIRQRIFRMFASLNLSKRVRNLG